MFWMTYRQIESVMDPSKRGLENLEAYLLNSWRREMSHCPSASSERNSNLVRTWTGTGNVQLCVFALSKDAVLLVAHNKICVLSHNVSVCALLENNNISVIQCISRNMQHFFHFEKHTPILGPLPPSVRFVWLWNVEKCEPLLALPLDFSKLHTAP